jgi:hypothetical protein
MDISPTPEFMEAMGRAIAKYGKRHAFEFGLIQTEMASMRRHGDTVRAGLVDVQAQHHAVAQRYPHLYKRADQQEAEGN